MVYFTIATLFREDARLIFRLKRKTRNPAAFNACDFTPGNNVTAFALNMPKSYV